MSGEPDALDVQAREVLLDPLEPLGEHRGSLILVGAQAVYLHRGEADIAIAPFTTDADMVIDSEHLAEHPTLGEALGPVIARTFTSRSSGCQVMPVHSDRGHL